MSKIIKASRITGEYKLSNVEIEKKIKDRMEDNSRDNKSSEEEIEEKLEKKKAQVVKEAEARAEELIAEAEVEADEIIQNAENEAENIKKEAEKEGYDSGYELGREEGFKAGHDDGYEKGLNEFEDKLKDLDSILQKTEAHFEEELERLPAEVINLSIEVASRIVNKEIDLEPGLINNIIFDILEEIGDAHEDITIKVNPDMIDYINKVDITSSLGQQSLEFVSDSSLNPGDCIVETEFGGKDATIENKLDILEKKLYQGAGYHEES